MTRLYRFIVRVVAVVAVAACGSSDKPAPAPAPKDAAPLVVDQSVPVAKGDQYTPEQQVLHLDEPKLDLPKQEAFKLVDPGTGAKAPLVYAFATTGTQIEIETKLSSRHLDNGTWSPKVDMPPIKDGFAIASETGNLVLRGLPGSITGTATKEAEQYLQFWKSLLQDRRASVAVDARGQFGKISFLDDPTNKRSEPSRNELANRLLVTIVPVPAEPIGTGASWKVVTVLRQNQVSVKQTATYTLIERTPEKWTIGIKVQRIGHEQTIPDPSLPKGATAELVAMLRDYTGTVEIDPRRAMIAKGALTIESRFHIKITTPGQPAIEHVVEDTGSVAIRTP